MLNDTFEPRSKDIRDSLTLMSPMAILDSRPPLWNPEGVEHGPGDVEEAHEDEPAHRRLVDGLLPTVLRAAV